MQTALSNQSQTHFLTTKDKKIFAIKFTHFVREKMKRNNNKNQNQNALIDNRIFFWVHSGQLNSSSLILVA